jgi:hypothetical protein
MRKRTLAVAKRIRGRKSALGKKATRTKMAAHARKSAGRKKASRGKRAGGRRIAAWRERTAPRMRLAPNWVEPEEKGPGPEAGGQSGDIQGLSGVAKADSESVVELAEEGQAFEAEVVSGVENAPDADVAEVTTREVPEDDVPPEYRERE